MTPDTSLQTAVLLLGGGANGKSTFLRGVAAFLGQANTAHYSPQELAQDPYAAAGLAGKLANICTDLPSARLADTGRFKSIVADDPIEAQRRYVSQFTLRPYARLVFAANYLPASLDSSRAYYLRWLLVPFDRVFEGASRIPQGELDSRLGDPGELSGVLNRALEAMPSLRRHGFSDAASLHAVREEFQQATDPLVAWLNTEIVDRPNAVLPRDRLKRTYDAYCQAASRPILTDQRFGRALRAWRPDLEASQRTVDGQRTRAWLGIDFRKDAGRTAGSGRR